MKLATMNRRLAVLVAAAVLGLCTMGNDGGGCVPIPPDVTSVDTQCRTAADCDGLPHTLCTGGWQCVSGKCGFQCDTTVPPPACYQGGCSGEVCSTDPAAVSNCLWVDWYACLKLTKCGNFGAGGGCGFEQNDAFLKCMKGQGCASDADCPAGLRCDATTGACAKPVMDPGCQVDADCPAGQKCEWTAACPECDCPPGAMCKCPAGCETRGTCVAGPVGCTVDADCPAGQACVFPDCPVCNCKAGDSNCACPMIACLATEGNCQQVCVPTPEVCDGIDNDCNGIIDDNCTAGCQGDADCPAGQVCAFDAGCGPCACASTDPACECPMCMPAQHGTCVPGPAGCTSDSECPAGQVCVPTPCPLCDCAAGAVECACPAIACPTQGTCQVVATGCQADSDCPAGQVCALNAGCAPCECDPSAGTACACPACPPSPYGTCVPATTGCSSDAECPPGQACVMAGCPVCDCKAGDPTCACPMIACLPQGTCQVVCVPSPEVCDGIDNDCNGIVDDGCSPQCTSDADCLEGETCDAGATTDPTTGMLACCPYNAKCIAGIPACGAGTCKPAAGRCWVDSDCAAGETCIGASRCPPGAMCLVADHVGTCTATQPLSCADGTPCPAGQVCTQQTTCPDCYYQVPACLAPCKVESVCVPECMADSDCPTGYYCQVLRCGDPTARCLGPYACQPLPTPAAGN